MVCALRHRLETRAGGGLVTLDALCAAAEWGSVEGALPLAARRNAWPLPLGCADARPAAPASVQLQLCSAPAPATDTDTDINTYTDVGTATGVSIPACLRLQLVGLPTSVTIASGRRLRLRRVIPMAAVELMHVASAVRAVATGWCHGNGQTAGHVPNAWFRALLVALLEVRGHR